ncbi:hypothetical protein HNY73_018349 [Argiope bruennichi]|uniref:Insulin-like domain-containing protein n=1 Tax=Argiope bruennichi TaxID=94029 RepID=A0A8T0EDL1_ARGBR|nr:hypothetical protein HNY73_018349 [Argiope bruennichi]
MLKIALLLLALAVIQFSQGSSSMEKNRRVKRGSTIRMCGKNLVQTLSLFCNGEYYDPNENSNVQTRDVRYSLEDPIQIWIATTLSSIYRDEASSKTVPEHIPTSHLFKRYGQGGIVDECCRKACQRVHLADQCHNALLPKLYRLIQHLIDKKNCGQYSWLRAFKRQARLVNKEANSRLGHDSFIKNVEVCIALHRLDSGRSDRRIYHYGSKASSKTRSHNPAVWKEPNGDTRFAL